MKMVMGVAPRYKEWLACFRVLVQVASRVFHDRDS